MATVLYSGTIGAGATVTATTLNLPTRRAVGPGSVGVYITGLYASVSGTTGLDTQVAFSNDGGATFTDFQSLNIVTTPTAGTASAKMATIAAPSGATTAKLQIVNKDATNGATAVTLQYAEQW